MEDLFAVEIGEKGGGFGGWRGLLLCRLETRWWFVWLRTGDCNPMRKGLVTIRADRGIITYFLPELESGFISLELSESLSESEPESEVSSSLDSCAFACFVISFSFSVTSSGEDDRLELLSLSLSDDAMAAVQCVGQTRGRD